MRRLLQMLVFRKNIYTREIIDFILELIIAGQKIKPEIMQQCRIPKRLSIDT
ncbi:hypothetical protein [uncultured Chryseobacterium sp.]|uniref:hypothetical protein n=1 Tax=uncultured Chryseobacterium sp. TaxID=259322 RepID=UPI0034132A14